MANDSSDLLPEHQRLLIERIFNELSWGKSADVDKTNDAPAMPALCAFFNSVRTLPSFDQL